MRSEKAAEIEWPRITLVTPSFNQGAFLEGAIRSVLLQGYPNLEYIVVDGGSTDGSVDVIRKHEPQLHHWVSEPDRGQSHAINKGMAAGTGEVCGWLCADDVLMPGALLEVGRFFAEHPEAEWITGQGEFVDAATGERKRRAGGITSPLSLLRFWTYGGRGSYLPQPSTFWRRGLWKAVGGVNEGNHLSMDYELWLAFEERAALQVMDEVLSVSRLHEECKTVRQRREQIREMMACAYAAAARRGYGRSRLTRDMLRWVLRRQWRCVAQQLQARRWRGTYWELSRLLQQAQQVWCEDGRLRLVGGEP